MELFHSSVEGVAERSVIFVNQKQLSECELTAGIFHSRTIHTANNHLTAHKQNNMQMQ